MKKTLEFIKTKGEILNAGSLEKRECMEITDAVKNTTYHTVSNGKYDPNDYFSGEKYRIKITIEVEKV